MNAPICIRIRQISQVKIRIRQRQMLTSFVTSLIENFHAVNLDNHAYRQTGAMFMCVYKTRWRAEADRGSSRRIETTAQ